MERGRELAALASAMDGAREGVGSVTVIEGEAGTGKTRLLAEADQLAVAREMAVLRARGAELERGYPFGVMRQLLESRIAAMDGTEAREVLSGAAAPVEPVLRGSAPDEPPPRDALFSVVHGLYWLCLRLCERQPILFAVDDLQWADEPSLRALAYLATRVEELPAAIVVAVRTGEEPTGAETRSLTEDSRAVVSLDALSEEGTADLLGDLLGSVDPAFAAAAHRVTGGNPFLVREVALNVATARIEPDERGAREIAELAPGTVARWALGRLERLPRSAWRLARSLSVLEQAELDILASHAGVTLEETVEILDRLAAAGFVEGRPLRFAHPIVRAALYGEMPPAARERAHRRAAEVLRDAGRPPHVVASHLLRSEPRGERWAVDALRAAAGEATSRGDARQAARLLDHALLELGDADDPPLLLELGIAETALHQNSAIGHLELAASAAGDVQVRAAARATLAHALYATGDFRSAFEAGREALDEIPRGEGGRLEAELLMSYLMAGRAIPELIPDVRRRQATPRLGAEGEVTPAELVRLQTSALDAFMRGERDEARRLVCQVDEALGRPATLADVPTLLAAGVGFLLAGIGDHDGAGKAFERCLGHALARGSPLETAETLESRVAARWWYGDVTGCLADVETILSLVGEEPDLAKVPARMCQAIMLVERDDLDGAEAALALPPELEQDLPGTWAWIALPFGRARIALARNDWHRANDEAVAVGDRVAAIDAPSPEFFPWRSLAARALSGLGEARRATEKAREELELARAIGSPRATGTALATLGAIDADPEALKQAIVELDHSGGLLGRAQARLDLGVLLRRSRRVRAAREPLREVLDIARMAGSTTLAEHARSELRAAGARPRRERTTGTESLTPRERQIAELAAAGLGNPQIAEQLFVTRKTVESHMRSVFRKLNVRGRKELPAVLRINP